MRSSVILPSKERLMCRKEPFSERSIYAENAIGPHGQWQDSPDNG